MLSKKHIFIILYLILVFILSSCSDSSKSASAVLYDEETALTFSDQTISHIKSLSPPDGVIVIFTTEKYIDSAHTAKRADQLFDYFSKKYNGFEERGVAIVTSIEPQLVQVRVGSNYSYYLKMKGVTSGHDYISMQESIPKRGLEAMIPVFAEHTIEAIKSYKESSWFTKLKVRLGVTWVGELLYDMASPSESVFGKIVTSIVHFIAKFIGIGGSWFFSLLLAILLMFLLHKGIDYLFPDGENDPKFGKLSLTNYKRFTNVNFLFKFVTDIIVGLPSFAAITILSNARTEDAIMLRQANIPHLELMNWANNNYSQTPSVILLFVLAIVIYLSYITVPGRIISMAGLRGNIQRHIYHCNIKLRDECFKLYKGRKAELNILAGVIIIVILIPIVLFVIKIIGLAVGYVLSGLGVLLAGIVKVAFEQFFGGEGPEIDITGDNPIGETPEEIGTELRGLKNIKIDNFGNQVGNNDNSETENIKINYDTIDATNKKLGTPASMVAGVIFGSLVENKPSSEYAVSPASGLLFTTCLTIIAGEIFSTPIIIYLILFLVLQTIWNFYKEFNFYRYISKLYSYYTTDLSYSWFIKSEIGYLIGSFCIITILLYYSSSTIISSSAIEQPAATGIVQPANTNYNGIEGTYYVREQNGEKVDGVTAVLKSNNRKDYIMTVYSDALTENYHFSYDANSGKIVSEELGDGEVTIKKSINQIKIKFKKGWTIVR